MNRSILALPSTVVLCASALVAPTVAPSVAAEPSPKALAQNRAAAWVADHPSTIEKATRDVVHRVGTWPGGAGIHTVAYERTHDGLPVIGGDFVVITGSDGSVIGSTVAQEAPVRPATTTPRIMAKTAAATSRDVLDEVADVGEPQLVLWHRDGGAELAWETEVRGVDAGMPSQQLVYVDAGTGSVLETAELVAAGTGTAANSGPNPVTFPTRNSGGTYVMQDPDTPSLNCQDYTTREMFTGPDDVWGNGDPADKETACVDALYAAQQMAGMLAQWAGRDGVDGSGGFAPMLVGLDDERFIGAFWSRSGVSIGYTGTPEHHWSASVDVVSHELGHGVDDYTPSGLSRSGTREFVADVFGASAEWYDAQPAPYDTPDWTIAEQVDFYGEGPIRDMADPASKGQPACWSTAIPSSSPHRDAGPGNHWFYLLSAGGTSRCNGDVVTGIGVASAIRIFYNAMLMKTSASSYLTYRTWTLTAAKNLDPSCRAFTSVRAAWDAVDVPAQPNDPTCG
ncbi:M4 family metallopeptidase [Phycicoccus sp. CSK15P-2]|uniref:M4 family metallopeptidase n=1 Tax=Phycicoccus sp. CSK15P-2 TaxID=2807627 RepID=UPI00194DB5F2|nr:M4 family metallopeptidase [Phycicoccus sp. CSK15P-2]MBM6403948.1 M4 family metallopeptidase [Phycicoccus sp. CSK15P-2]